MKALGRLRGFTGSSEPSLMAYVIRTKITCASWPIYILNRVTHTCTYEYVYGCVWTFLWKSNAMYHSIVGFPHHVHMYKGGCVHLCGNPMLCNTALDFHIHVHKNMYMGVCVFIYVEIQCCVTQHWIFTYVYM